METAPISNSPLTCAATERALRDLVGRFAEDGFTHFKLAEFLIAQKREDEAIGPLRVAIGLQPDLTEGLRALGGILIRQKEVAEGVELLRRAVASRPDDVEALCDLGNALVTWRRGKEGAVYLEQALRLLPRDHRLHSNLGLAYAQAGMMEEAVAACRAALEIKPMFVGGLNNLGHCFIVMGEHEKAIACFDLAEALDQNHVNTKCNRAIALLAIGDFSRGWRDYQWRWERPESPHRSYAQPLWRGEALDGRRILLHTEEGLGDRIQMIRYVGLLRERGAYVICETPGPLMKVFGCVPGVDELVQLGDALPAFDCHAPLFSLPFYFETTLETIPAAVPYIAAAGERVAAWRRWLGEAVPGGLKVGIYWQGNPHHEWDAFRSMPLMAFEPLARRAGVRLVSLQRGPGVEQIAVFNRLTGNALAVPTDGGQAMPGDLADTAGLMASLDLVLTVDTATAHLAGAMGRPVWTLLSAATDWRWLRERADTPWYPTMRLFRQKRLNDWDEVITRVAACMPI